jgi:hypothetical protein
MSRCPLLYLNEAEAAATRLRDALGSVNLHRNEVPTMTRLTLPQDIGRQLTSAASCLELCDEVGRTIGYFTPAVVGLVRGPQVSDDELERRDQDEPSYTTAQVLAHLMTL